MDIYIGLVHHPVRNRHGERVATAVTNLDIPDIARAARTFGIRGYFLVTPVAQQRSLVERIVTHWRRGEGKTFNPTRAESFELVRVAPDVDTAVETITAETGTRPLVVATGAGFDERDVTWQSARERFEGEEGVALVLFGTGWGLDLGLTERCDLRLPAIRAARGDGYNHLSVRSAVAIVLDRLCGSR